MFNALIEFFAILSMLGVPLVAAGSAQLIQLPNPPSTTSTFPRSINNGGTVIGYCNREYPLGTISSVWADGGLTNLPNADRTFFVSISDNGVLAGAIRVDGVDTGALQSMRTQTISVPDADVSYFGKISPNGRWATGFLKGSAPVRVLFDASTNVRTILTPPSPYPYLEPYAVNDTGDVGGLLAPIPGASTRVDRGFLATNGVVSELHIPGYPGFIPRSINNAGLAAGNDDLYYQTGQPSISAVLDTHSGHVTPLANAHAGDGTFVWGMNELGDVVGYGLPGDGTSYPLLWRSGSYDHPVELLTLLSGDAANSFFEPVDINDNGDIVGLHGYLNPSLERGLHAAVITGVLPEPTSAAMLGLLLFGTATRRGR